MSNELGLDEVLALMKELSEDFRKENNLPLAVTAMERTTARLLGCKTQGRALRVMYLCIPNVSAPNYGGWTDRQEKLLSALWNAIIRWRKSRNLVFDDDGNYDLDREDE